MVTIKESDVRDLRYRELSFGDIASANFQFSDFKGFHGIYQCELQLKVGQHRRIRTSYGMIRKAISESFQACGQRS